MGVIGAAVALFAVGQNCKRRVGGPISPAKALWLNYALVAWFPVCRRFSQSALLPPRLRRIYSAHLLSWTIRGVVEAWLLYGPRAWKPPYGIAHDVFDFSLICCLDEGVPTGHSEQTAGAAERFLTSIRCGLACEIAFAGLFYAEVQGRTGGEDGVWFASDEERFRRINAITWAVVIPAYLDLAWTLYTGRDALFPVLGDDTRDAA